MSNVTDFSHMFFIATSFNQDITNWNVCSGRQFQFMFAKAKDFSYNLRNWSVTEGANLISMFVFASALHSLHSDITEFADTPVLSSSIMSNPRKRFCMGTRYDISVCHCRSDNISNWYHLHRNAHNSRNVNSGVQHIRTKVAH